MERRQPERSTLKTADLAQAGERDRERMSADRPQSVPGSGRERRPDNQDTGATPALPAATPLVDQSVAQALQSRWNTIQVSFVDEPRRAVEQADGLVAETM